MIFGVDTSLLIMLREYGFRLYITVSVQRKYSSSLYLHAFVRSESPTGFIRAPANANVSAKLSMHLESGLYSQLDATIDAEIYKRIN